MDTLQEKTYIEQTLRGNNAAYAVLVNAYKDHIFTLLLRIVRQREQAEELTQDVFLKAFRHLHTFNRQAKFSTWIYRIAYNTAISEVRKRKIQVQELKENYMLVPDDNEGSKKERLLTLLNTAVTQLLPEEAALISLFYTENKTMEEIGKITGMSLSNVKTKIHRTRNKLRKQIEGTIINE